MTKLFSKLTKEALADDETYITVNRVEINYLIYAYDTVLSASSKEKLQELVNLVNNKSNKADMNLNVKKLDGNE